MREDIFGKMKWVFFCIFVFPALLFGAWDELFRGDGDPALAHHVNVISGNLQLFFEDQVIQGAVPIHITRTYSSAGHNEVPQRKKIDLRSLQTIWQPEGGWSFFPHLQMLVDPRRFGYEHTQVHLKEPSGSMITYQFVNQEGDITIMRPEGKRGQSVGVISGRLNPSNHRIHLNYKKGEATVYLADGGKRIYKGNPRSLKDKIADNRLYDFTRDLRYYLLQEEISSSGQRTVFDYDQAGKRISITQYNPTGTKIYASIVIAKMDGNIFISSNTGQHVKYTEGSFNNQNTIASVETISGPTQLLTYSQMRRGQGIALDRITMLDQEQLYIEYYRPANKQESKQWEASPHLKPFEIDRVKTISQGGQCIASFTYAPGMTDVRDANHILTRYHYRDDDLLLIEYFDEDDQLYSSQKFTWKEGYLVEKSMCDNKGVAVVSKTFTYDNYGSVLQETLISDQHFSKWYAYDPHTHLLIRETEENGLTYNYSYLPNTDLVITKWICDGDEVIASEHFTYDEDHLLISESMGNLEKRYRRDPTTGMVIAIENNGGRVEYTYSLQWKILQEDIFDKERQYRYSIHCTYDKQGNLIAQTTPCGKENRYSYDAFHNLISCKEVGSPKKTFLYDSMHRPISCTIEGKTTYTTYDMRGLILSQTNHLGYTTNYTYDAFGRCIRTDLPLVTLEFGYDILGNQIFCKNPRGEVQRTRYNVFRKPIEEIFPDGSRLDHSYHPNGTLKETLHQDGSKTTYTHDLFQRMTSRATPLGKEIWIYSPTELLSYTDETGLMTTFLYDDNGRKIEEITLDRKTAYTYDALGFLESTTRGDIRSVQIHDEEGKVVEEHQNGENRTFYSYDEENRKNRIVRITSEGEATDLIEYDAEGRIIRHTDPNYAITELIYDDFTKTTIDPLGNIVIETQDVLARVIQVERKTAEGERIALEENIYDLSGNLVKKISHVYENGHFLRKTEISWRHNFRGEVTEERELEKITTYAYDNMGRLVIKTLPNGLILQYSYDEGGRLSNLTSSDHTIDYEYFYQLGQDPIKIEDKIHHTALRRTYSAFGEIISEINDQNLHFEWEYDVLGREKSISLPDGSKIDYGYQGSHMTSVIRFNPQGKLLYEHTYDVFDTNGHVSEESMIFNLGKATTYHDLLERPYKTDSPFHNASRSFGMTGLVTAVQDSLAGSTKYFHDPLNQIIQENEHKYHFDSLGNPTDRVINDYNQLSDVFDYDANGNPTKNLKDARCYTYDGLGRLSTITDDQRKVEFVYDAYSRLSAKTVFIQGKEVDKRLYLYDQELEIGSIRMDGSILGLKVLGLGLEGDIGAAVAVEVGAEIYAPVYDFQGNIIALISTTGEVVENYYYNAFGKEESSDALSPWRFASKRNEEGLVYFGKRFYDTEHGRWLTPDPLGYYESANVYLYVLNSPLSRLDLFGLFSKPSWGIYFEPNNPIFRGGPHSCYIPQDQYVMCHSSDMHRGVFADFIVIGDFWHEIRFTPKEIEQNRANLFDHLHEIIPRDSKQIGLITGQNGICTSLEEFKINLRVIADNIFEGTVMIGLHNKPLDTICSLLRVSREMGEREMTMNATLTGLFIGGIADALQNLQSSALWLHIPHSEAGLLFNLGYTMLSNNQKEILQKQLIVFGVAPAEPISWKNLFEATNIYSGMDGVTARYGKIYKDNPDYDIRFIKCESTKKGLSLGLEEHSFTGPTYRNALRDKIKQLRGIHGFHDFKKR